MRKEGGNYMNKIFIKAKEVSEILQVSEQQSYKIIRKMNDELKAKGYLVVRGRVDRKYFFEHFYGTAKEREVKDAYI